MPKVKYKYNPHTLQYEKIEVNTRKRILQMIGFLFTAVVFGVILAFLGYKYIDSPKEKELKREISQLLLNYELLNKKLYQVSAVIYDLQERDDNIYRVIFESDPIPSSIRQAGVGGVNKYIALEGFTNSELMIETSRKLDNIAKRLYVQSKSYDELYEMAKNKITLLASIPAIQPISNKDLTRIASGYGFRIHPIYKTGKLHTGMDFTAPYGTDIYATGNGKIAKVTMWSRSGYGNHIIIDHGYGYETIYAHLGRIVVREGQSVKRGDLIGTVGNTGTSIGPHLHYEVIKDNIKINPINYFFNDLTPEEYDKVLEIASQHNQSFD